MDAMLKEQGGICAVCGIDPDHKWAVDHDHSCCPGTKSCGRCVRGILCDRCNTAIGTLGEDRKSTRLNSSHVAISYAVFCLKKKKRQHRPSMQEAITQAS